MKESNFPQVLRPTPAEFLGASYLSDSVATQGRSRLFLGTALHWNSAWAWPDAVVACRLPAAAAGANIAAELTMCEGSAVGTASTSARGATMADNHRIYNSRVSAQRLWRKAQRRSVSSVLPLKWKVSLWPTYTDPSLGTGYFLLVRGGQAIGSTRAHIAITFQPAPGHLFPEEFPNPSVPLLLTKAELVTPPFGSRWTLLVLPTKHWLHFTSRTLPSRY